MLLLVFCAVCLAQCKTGEKRNVASDKKQPITTLRNSVMGDTLKSASLNSINTLELRVTKIFEKGDPAAHFQYTIYKKETDAIVKSGEFRGMDVQWNDATSIKLVPYVGMEKKPESNNPLDASKSTDQNQTTIIQVNDSLN